MAEDRPAALVTGSASGIGRAAALRLARAGYDVAINYRRSEDNARRTLAELEALGGRPLALRGDVSDDAAVAAIVAAAGDAYGRLDVLVNNAGVYQFAALEEITEEQFHRQFNTNVLGLILATQEAAKLFGPEGGSVINIGSTASRLTPPTTAVYTATKGAVDAVTHVLAKELGPKKIRVNSINPGMVETEGVHTSGIIGSDFQKQMEAQTPLGRIAQPDDIAPIAVFLASADSGWLTGETLLASGGLR